MKKLLAVFISLVMVITMAATVFAEPADVTWEDYQQYLIDTAGVNAPDLAEFTAQVEAIGSWEEIDQTVSPWDQFFTTLGLSTWEEFQAGEVKELAVMGAMGGPGGESPEGEAPEGESPAPPAEGESPDGEAPAAPEGESEGESGESAPSEFEGVEYPTYDIDFIPYSSEKDYTVYDVRMTMQAGYQEYKTYEPGMMTIHAGIGYMDPFGEGFYVAGIMYPESFVAPEATYVSDWMDANYGCSLFCIYHTNVGDIYAWDGIYGANSKDMSN